MSGNVLSSGQFPVMGTWVANHITHAKPIKGRTVPTRPAKSDSPGPVTAVPRTAVLERAGGIGRIVVARAYSYENVAAARETGRNVRPISAASSHR